MPDEGNSPQRGRGLMLAVGGLVAAGAIWWANKRREARDDAVAGGGGGDPRCAALEAVGASAEVIAACRAMVGTPTVEKCEALRAAGASDQAVAACKAAFQLGGVIIDIGSGVVDAVITGQKTDLDNTNVPLNGPIVNADVFAMKAYMDAHQGKAYRFVGAGQNPIDATLVRYTIPQYSNGCVPAPGAFISDEVGYHKCVSGTALYLKLADRIQTRKLADGSTEDHSNAMTETGKGKWDFGVPSVRERGESFIECDEGTSKTGWRQMLSDVGTHPHWFFGDFDTSRGRDPMPFPLPYDPATQSPWWVAFQAMVAPQGTYPSVRWGGGSGGTKRAIDRVDWIVGPPTRPPPPPALPPGQLPGEIPTLPPPDESGYVWVPGVPPANGHWRRKRASEA